jgi:hypothetical protein
MSDDYLLDLTAIARLAHISADSARTYHKRGTLNRENGDPRPGDLPAPDTYIGRTPAWHRSTITAWLAARPRAGARNQGDQK